MNIYHNLHAFNLNFQISTKKLFSAFFTLKSHNDNKKKEMLTSECIVQCSKNNSNAIKKSLKWSFTCTQLDYPRIEMMRNEKSRFLIHCWQYLWDFQIHTYSNHFHCHSSFYGLLSNRGGIIIRSNIEQQNDENEMDFWWVSECVQTDIMTEVEFGEDHVAYFENKFNCYLNIKG